MDYESTLLEEMAKATRAAALHSAGLGADERTQAIEAMAAALEGHVPQIVAANLEDLEAAEKEGISAALYARLKMDEGKLRAEIDGVRSVGRLPDPVGRVEIHRELDAGLVLRRVTCPVGVLGIIFESRPDAVIQIASLAVKAGNGVILKGGRESLRSCQAIVAALREGLESSPVRPEAVQLLTTREEIGRLLELDRYVDLIIPRGSNSFVRYVQENTRIPVLGHADGMCHVYVDEKASIHKALHVVVDSKVQYPAACNAVETLLVHASALPEFLPRIAAALREKGVELRGDERSRAVVEMDAAADSDWSAEYLDLVLAVKVVDLLEEAVEHINTYGSRHTDAIVTEDEEAADTFLRGVDSAGVYVNCSTRFADGFRYGFGAEVGISTQKMPPRGPVGLEGLVTYKYQIVGDGHVVATYAGPDARPFTHRDLPLE
jgi:glutamate-5-semialdehyde dehydrogenase